MTSYFVCTSVSLSSVCQSVIPSLTLVRFRQLLRYADKRIANIMKVYIERNNLQVELIRLKKYQLYSCLLLRSEGCNAISLTGRKSTINTTASIAAVGQCLLSLHGDNESL